ncbi:MAG: cytochrome c biogenesis protein CcsA [Pseudomonadota bacterium]|jgi:ABC-type transport system involved in cytochrome c biogenesis permease subunit
MTHLAAVCSISLYLVGTVLFLLQLWRPSRTGRLKRAASLCCALAFALHSVTIGLVLRDPRFLVLENGADYFLWVSWLLALVLLAFRRWFDYPMLGAFITSAIVLFMGSSSYLLHQDTTSLIDQVELSSRQGLMVSLLHGVPALVSVVSLVLALAVSLAFLVVERRIKRRTSLALEVGGVSLQLLDRLNTQLVRIGFVAISLVIVSGGLWAVMERKSVFTADTSVLSGIVVWVLLAVILFVRLVLNWSPRRISRLTVLVAGSFLLSVFVVLALAGRTTHVSIWS